jgi:hypothetical protein
VRAVVCGSARISVRQYAGQCAAVRQCGIMQHCTAVCGSASSEAVLQGKRQCVAVRVAAVCGSARCSAWQWVEQCAAIQQ